MLSTLSQWTFIIQLLMLIWDWFSMHFYALYFYIFLSLFFWSCSIIIITEKLTSSLNIDESLQLTSWCLFNFTFVRRKLKNFDRLISRCNHSVSHMISSSLMSFFFFSSWFMLIHHWVCHQHVHSCRHLYERSFEECICNKSLTRFFIHVLKQIDDFECLNHLSMRFICNQSISFYISELLYWLWLFWSRSYSFRLILISHQCCNASLVHVYHDHTYEIKTNLLLFY